MEIQPDFRDLLALLNAHKVDYIVVGAHALAHYGSPRYTGDIDIFVRPDRENAVRIIETLKEFGFGSVGLAAEDFTAPDNVIQLGVAPVRVDLITSLTGVSWEQALEGSTDGTYGSVPVKYIGREQFITNKRAIGRKKDLADIEALGEI